MAKFLIDATSLEFVEGLEKADFVNHTHKAADIISGVFPLERGGTGGTTAAYARNNLDVYSKSEVDSAINSVDIDFKEHLVAFEIDVNTSGSISELVSYIDFGSAAAKLNNYVPICAMANYFYPNSGTSNHVSFPVVSVNAGGIYVINTMGVAYPYNHCKFLIFAVAQGDLGGDWT